MNNGQRISVIFLLLLLIYTSIVFIQTNKHIQNIEICCVWIASLGVEFYSFPAWNRKRRVTSIFVQGWILNANHWIFMKAKGYNEVKSIDDTLTSCPTWNTQQIIRNCIWNTQFYLKCTTNQTNRLTKTDHNIQTLMKNLWIHAK